ncbi:unnamed protein product [Acanthoscelides obtectus]|uniref:6-phosphogluconate dehydrogenase NADP-binding domain-containing protein n=1 Tax=Acanthoscelides obtectus TaxID=200917 RepID=A0A9P0LQB9_ACAOB|nr:unnamed protein product [Acanthoscelides obtectus]CAK1624144.1 Putative oxidoreductase GLYR1 homolog [Acanthoscelides obtectus]
MSNETSSIDLCSYDENTKKKEIKPSPKVFGFIGLGNIGAGVVKNLINSGHKVNLFNRTPKKIITASS